jgi:hypothetical protein
MTDPALNALIQAEIDGELDAAGRGELARRLLADPEARREREAYRRLGSLLAATPAIDPPASLARDILAALPQSQFRPRSWAAQWRLAAMLAGVLIAGAVVFASLKGPNPRPTELSGTLGASPTMTMVDTVRLGEGPAWARVSLYRERAQLALKVEMGPNNPADVVIKSNDYGYTIPGAGRPAQADDKLILLPNTSMDGQPVDVTLEVAGRPVAHATLRATER